MFRTVLAILALLATAGHSAGTETPSWPPPPDRARVEYVDEIRLPDLKPRRGLLGSVVGLIGGRSDKEKLQLPFDVVAFRGKLYVTCQDMPVLVEIDRSSNRFRIYENKESPFVNPLALCVSDDAVYITDSESRVVYRFDGEKIKPLITEGLERPTGIAWVAQPPRLYVVDTGNHTVGVFDPDGRRRGTLGTRGSAETGFNFPTFAAARDSVLLVNDTLNYRIKFFDASGFVNAIGEEGDGPGAFARPKGLAVDSRGYIYVVDALFDNIQVFDRDGRVLLVIGAAGNGAGQFWSPAGIDIAGDRIYVADTFNQRIQVLRIVGGQK